MDDKDDKKVTTNVPETKEEKDLVSIKIPDESLEAAASVAPEGYFAAITENGIYYKSFDHTVSSITGRIVGIVTYLGRFDGVVLSKIPLSAQPYPEGYQPRMELAIKDTEKTTNLSLSPTSASAAGSFFRHLKNSGLRPEHVWVRISVVPRVSKQGGRYGVAVFTIVSEMPPTDSDPDPTTIQASVETISTAQPAALNNPWAA
jgi:hypothetical protein